MKRLWILLSIVIIGSVVSSIGFGAVNAMLKLEIGTTVQGSEHNIALMGHLESNKKPAGGAEILVQVAKKQNLEVVYIQQLITDGQGKFDCQFSLKLQGKLSDYLVTAAANDFNQSVSGDLSDKSLQVGSSIPDSKPAPGQPSGSTSPSAPATPAPSAPITPAPSTPAAPATNTPPAYTPSASTVSTPAASSVPSGPSAVTPPVVNSGSKAVLPHESQVGKTEVIKTVDIKVESVEEEAIAKSAVTSVAKAVPQSKSVKPATVIQPTQVAAKLIAIGVIPKKSTVQEKLTAASMGASLKKLTGIKSLKGKSDIVAFNRFVGAKVIPENEKTTLSRSNLIAAMTKTYSKAKAVKLPSKQLSFDRQLKTETAVKQSAIQALNAYYKKAKVDLNAKATLADFAVVMEALFL